MDLHVVGIRYRNDQKEEDAAMRLVDEGKAAAEAAAKGGAFSYAEANFPEEQRTDDRITNLGILGGAWFANELSAWEWNSTTISGRPFRYQATLGEVLVNQILVGLLAGCTMYIGLPWAMVMRWDFEAKHIA